MRTTYQKQANMKSVTTVAALIVVAGMVMVTDHLRAKTTAGSNSLIQSTSSVTATQQPTTNSTATPPSVPTPSSSNSSGYKDGTYTTTLSYYVPHSSESIQVSLTLSNGVITNASIQNSEGDSTSASYQESFASMYKSSVVGKKISGLQLDVIGGASDTTQGFDDALSEIASKAQA